MDDIESLILAAIEYTPPPHHDPVTYGALTGLLRVLDAVQAFPNSAEPTEPTDVAGWLRVYETALHVLEQLPIEGISAEAHADLLTYVRKRHTWLLSKRSARRGDPNVLLAESNIHRAEADCNLALLGRHVHGEIDLRSEEWIPESMR